ncbi:ABC transporter ATP-binding protein [Haladaptatus caseinilyticus]|uniref:ABC transporter ATP-binding protein n=1 Tax=Haladaptatus caseinilyticus TaxID=2993314 RepID=UPI00224A6B7C|nr:ABC transporter ATP-binding protein [Haladaptatus caseinilyticus]
MNQTTTNFDFDDGAPLLEAEELDVTYTTSSGELTAVDGISFAVDEDEIFGLVGESGCGKSTVAQAILSLLPSNGRVASGSIRFRGVELTELSKREMDALRWEHLSLISQGAMNALNPVHRISSQIIEAIQAHRDVSKADARERVAELFEVVGLDPDRMDDYPHQFSGGMKQRAYIAMSLALDPDLIIADEPTTALDVIVQDQILKRLKELRDELGISVIIISHDISVIAETCNRLGVMYSGKLMEYGDLRDIFSDAFNPYTLGLQNAFPTLRGEQQNLISIPGSPPSIADLPSGCRFMQRCPFAVSECAENHPPLYEVGEDHYSACYRHDVIEMIRRESKRRETWQRTDKNQSGLEGYSDD